MKNPNVTRQSDRRRFSCAVEIRLKFDPFEMYKSRKKSVGKRKNLIVPYSVDTRDITISATKALFLLYPIVIGVTRQDEFFILFF